MKTNQLISALLIGVISCSTEFSTMQSQNVANNDSITPSKLIETNDTIFSKQLKEVTIRATPVIHKNDRDVYLPTKSERAVSKNGVQLLSNMQIPTLSVDPINNGIGLLSRGNLSLRINGRPATVTDIQALTQEDITKVEYIKDPSLRYGEAEAVLDFIVKKRNSGGVLNINAVQGVYKGWGDYSLATSVHLHKSEFGAQYSTNPMWNIKVWRDNEEQFRLADGKEIKRSEIGTPELNHDITQKGKLYYNYFIPKKMLFSLEMRFSHKDESNKISGIIGANDKYNTIIDNNPSKSLTPTVDAYLQYSLSPTQTIYSNASFTYSSTESQRNYIVDGASLVNSKIDSKDKSLFAEVSYEKQFTIGAFTASANYSQLWTRTEYSNSIHNIFNNYDLTPSMSLDWRQKVDKISYSVGLTGKLYSNHNESDNNNYSHFSVNPIIMLRYTPSKTMTLKFQANTKTVLPSPNEIYPLKQQIDEFQYVQGNKNLKPFQIYSPRIEYEYYNPRITCKLVAAYEYAPGAIMSYKEVDKSAKILKSYDNHKFWQHLDAHAEFSVQLIANILKVSGTLGWTRYDSRGENYTHSYNQFYGSADIFFTYQRWFAMAKLSTNRNRLWGENIETNNGYNTWNLQIFGVGYAFKHINLTAGVTNPLNNNFHITSKDLNANAGYTREYYTNCPQNLVWINVSFNTSWGKKFKSSKRNIEKETIRESVKVQSK
ncbi:MAG: hypothetical protein PHR45_01170 [Muribaculaceae bacterium]|nr:hypothetical protein [Muribaculaceae bacterium]